MSDPFLAEIRLFPCNFAPKGWALCEGQLLSISQNTALFALLGTMYGGDGKVTFGLPNLLGAAAMEWGQGAGLQNYDQGQQGGTPYVTLLQSEMPAHNHLFYCNSSNGTVLTSSGNMLSRAYSGNLRGSQQIEMYSAAAASTSMSPSVLAVAGGSQPHNNMMPYLSLNYCIALQGIFPQRQ